MDLQEHLAATLKDARLQRLVAVLPDPKVEEKVKEGIDMIPRIIAAADRFDDWAPLLKLPHGDVTCQRAAERLSEMLRTKDIKVDISPNPHMMDMSQYLFVELASLIAAIEAAK